MVNFEEGTLIKGAYVLIDGKEYEVHMPEYSGNTPMSPENLNKLQNDILKIVFPVGSRYVTQEDKNPREILGFGTWERSKGKVFIGLDEEDENFNEIGKTGGEKTHILTVEEMPTHSHPADGTKGLILASNSYAPYAQSGVIDTTDSGLDWDTQIAPQGGNEAHNNLQPYEVVGYVWIRRG